MSLELRRAVACASTSRVAVQFEARRGRAVGTGSQVEEDERIVVWSCVWLFDGLVQQPLML